MADAKDYIVADISLAEFGRTEITMAERIRDAVPSMEMSRLVSSGTEATMGALRVARGYTGRDLIVKCIGGYHGGADYLLVKGGSGLATLGEPDSAGVPASFAATTITRRIITPSSGGAAGVGPIVVQEHLDGVAPRQASPRRQEDHAVRDVLVYEVVGIYAVG